MEITATIKRIGETKQVSEKFRTRTVVIEDNSTQYPQIIELQASQDRVTLLDSFAVGNLVKIQFNLRGREWTNKEGEIKVFNTLDIWRIENVGQNTESKSQPQTEQSQQVQQPKTVQSEFAPQHDDLPF